MSRVYGVGPGVADGRPRGRGDGHGAKPLTDRELQVLAAVREAKANAQIAVMLGISPLTVKNHLRSIQKKLGARNRAHAVAEAMSRRLIN
jgi:DNA-binding CsgD family transcriptional regulator